MFKDWETFKKNWKKNLARINLTIDAIMLVLLMAISGLGLLMKYVLLPGFKRNEVYGKDVELYFWNLTRHDWGEIHFWLSLAFLFLLLLHIILHWKLILGIFRRMLSARSLRISIAAFIGLLSLGLAFVPLAIKPEIGPPSHDHSHGRGSDHNLPGKGQGRQLRIYDIENEFSEINVEKTEKSAIIQKESSSPEDDPTTQASHDHSRNHASDHIEDDVEVFGYMTLNEVAEKYNISAARLAEAMKIPQDQTQIRLGHLKRSYGFSMTDVRIAAQKISKSNK